MEQEQAVVDIDIADGGASLAIGAHVGQLVVFAKRLAVGSGADAAGDIEFLADDVVPDAVDGVDVRLVARQGSHVGHARIHVGSPHGVPHRLVLFHNGLVCLRIVVGDGGLAPIVEEELGLVEVFLLSRHQIEFGKRHLCNLVSRHDTSLSRLGTHFAAHAVGIADGDVEKLARARGLIVGDGTFHHVP